MATRRINASRQQDDIPVVRSTQEQAPSDIRPAVPGSVIAKLLGFTFAMITLPLGSYFASVNAIFGGNSTYAGALAAVMANVVLISYVIVAMNEDQGEQAEATKKGGKVQ